MRVDAVQLKPLHHQIPDQDVSHFVQSDADRQRGIRQCIGLGQSIGFHSKIDVLLKQAPLQGLQQPNVLDRLHFPSRGRLAIQIQDMKRHLGRLKAKQIALDNGPGIHRYRLHAFQHRAVPDDFERRVGIPAVSTTLQRHAFPIRLPRVHKNDAITLAGRIKGSSQRAERTRLIAHDDRGAAIKTVVADFIVDMDLALRTRTPRLRPPLRSHIEPT